MSFLPGNLDAVKQHFIDPADAEAGLITTEEIKRGVTGIWRGLGSEGLLGPEEALFLVRTLDTVEEIELKQCEKELTKAKTENMKLRNIELQEKLNRVEFPEPENDYNPPGSVPEASAAPAEEKANGDASTE